MTNLLQRLRLFRKNEEGYSSLEFVLVASTFLTGFFWVFEMGLLLTKEIMLERAVDMTVRELRLYSNVSTELQNVKNRICELSMLLDDCNDNLLLEMDTFDVAVGFSGPITCVDKEHDITPELNFNVGQRSEIVYMRACIVVYPMLTQAFALFKDTETRGLNLYADTAFVNEPE